MINYSSYNDAWGIKSQTSNLSNNKLNDISNIEEFRYEDKKVNNNYSNKKLIKKNNCEKCNNINDILECDECLLKLKKRLDMIDEKPRSETLIETFTEQVGSFNLFVKNNLKDICNSKRKRQMLLLFLIILFIVSTFIFIKGRGVVGEGSEADVEVLAEATESGEGSKLKYLTNFNNMENFVLVPKSMIKFNNNGLTPTYY